MTSPEDQLFLLKSEYARDRRLAEEQIDDLQKILSDIWDEKCLTRKLWERIAELLEQPEEDIPVMYDPEPITKSDLLKLQQRVTKLERAMDSQSLPVPP